MRRISGKDISKAKELAAEQEMKRALEQKKREKKEEAEARARIKAQIEEDRKARAEKVIMEDVITDVTTLISLVPPHR